LRNLQDSGPALADALPELPVLAHRFLDQATSGNLKVEWSSQELKQLRREVRHANRRTAGTVVGTGLLIAAAVIYGLDGYAPAMVLGAPLLSWLGLVGGLLLIILNWPDDRDGPQDR
ncbi:MAG: ubiquinone biosynthesis regulatory protein kinase UbiB, partial [Gammaproteobacteria bacterium]